MIPALHCTDTLSCVALVFYIAFGIDRIPVEKCSFKNYSKLFPLFIILALTFSYFVISSDAISNKIFITFLLSIAISSTLSKINSFGKYDMRENFSAGDFLSGKLPGLFSDPLITTLDKKETTDDTANSLNHSLNDEQVPFETSIQSNTFNENSLGTEVRTWENGYGPQGLGDVKVSNCSKLGN